MMSPFSRLIDLAIGSQFRKDPSGRTVFLPLISKRDGYFVDSKPDEDKIRSFVKMYRSAMLLVTLLGYITIYSVPTLMNAFARPSPLKGRLVIFAWVSLVSMLIFLAAVWILWSTYKVGIRSVTSSLPEAGPDVLSRLRDIARPRRTIVFMLLGAGAILCGAALLGGWYPFHR
jgi:hypothetical protein